MPKLAGGKRVAPQGAAVSVAALRKKQQQTTALQRRVSANRQRLAFGSAGAQRKIGSAGALRKSLGSAHQQRRRLTMQMAKATLVASVRVRMRGLLQELLTRRV